jgi:hypothetical protein
MMAQSTGNDKTSFAVLGGVNFQNITGDDASGNKISSSGIIGFHAGVQAMIPVAPEFYFQPGILFSTKGSKNESILGTTSINLAYVEVPLNFVYKSKLGGGSIYLGFGPYVGYGIKGNTKVESSLGSVKSDVKFQNKVISSDPLSTTYIKPLDFGGNVLVGYELSSGLFLQLNTQLGLVNIQPEYASIPNNKSSLKNVGFGLSIGYSF